jgi:hypothetical protein
LKFYGIAIFGELGFKVGGVEVVVVDWEPADGRMSNPYVLEVVSIIGDLVMGVSAPYLKIIVAFVVPGAVAA